jgi:hypothetical protein
MNKIYVGDLNTEIQVDCVSDISQATAYAISVVKPDGTKVDWPAELIENSVSIISYSTVLGDLNVAGVYRLQAVVTMPNWQGRGETDLLPVYKHYA